MYSDHKPSKSDGFSLEMQPKKRRAGTTEDPHMHLFNTLQSDDKLQGIKRKLNHSCTHTDTLDQSRCSRGTTSKCSAVKSTFPCATDEEVKQNKTRHNSISEALRTKARSISRRIRKHMLNSVYLFHEDAYGVSWTTVHNMLAQDSGLHKYTTLSTPISPNSNPLSPVTNRRSRMYVLDKPAREQVVPVSYRKCYSVGADQSPYALWNESLNQLSPTILENIEEELNKRHGQRVQRKSHSDKQNAKLSKSADIPASSSRLVHQSEEEKIRSVSDCYPKSFMCSSRFPAPRSATPDSNNHLVNSSSQSRRQRTKAATYSAKENPKQVVNQESNQQDAHIRVKQNPLLNLHRASSEGVLYRFQNELLSRSSAADDWVPINERVGITNPAELSNNFDQLGQLLSRMKLIDYRNPMHFQAACPNKSCPDKAFSVQVI